MRWQNQTHGANCTKFIYKDILYWCLVGIYFGKLYHEALLTHAHITWEPDLHENTIANLYENMNGNGACVSEWGQQGLDINAYIFLFMLLWESLSVTCRGQNS